MKQVEYPIRAVSNETGLSVDTLRAWERRYKAVVPARTRRGRVYTRQDIERLVLLRKCTELGYSIGQIARWEDQQLREALNRLEQSPEMVDAGDIIVRLMNALKSFDTVQFDRELGRVTILYSPEALVHRVVLPFMKSVGDQWKAGRLTIAQEHFASANLRNVLGAMLRFYSRSNSEISLIFATPKEEFHEFGILAAAMIAAAGGLNVLYLGTNIPADEILHVLKQTSPKAVVLGWKAANGAEQSLVEIKKLSKTMPRRIELWIGGLDSETVQKKLKNTSAVLIPDFQELEKHLSLLGWRS